MKPEDNDKLLNHKKVNSTFKRKMTAVLADVRKGGSGLPICLVEVYRSPARQLMLYLKGITKMKFPKYHGNGCAADSAFVINGKITWDVPKQWWEMYMHAAEQHGLEAGGRWKSRDYGHVQWNGK